MATTRNGVFGGFEFDPEVFAQMMQEADYWRAPVIASNIIQNDPSIMDLIGQKGNVATIPIYKPLNAYEDGMEALNNDGETDNTPVEVSGSKQTCMLIQRMKAFQAKDFTKELTGADPLTNIRNKIAGYYLQVWESELMNIAGTVLTLSDLSDHVLDLTGGDLATSGMIYDAEQAALGDMAGGLGLIVMHSKIYAEYQKLDLVEFEKYVTDGAIRKDIQLPTIAGKYVLVTDYNTLANGVYSTYLFGEGAFLACDKNNYEKQYYTDYDPESSAGIEKFYTKQGKVLHPNGLSLAVDNIAKESPTKTELGTAANWALKYNTKNVKMGVIQTGTTTA
ncbi:MAG: major capsid protein [Clostridiales bacterium]|nr:major capsid protein [Clostridiales bacterium]